jgi:HK97 family phage major capsid protein
MKITFDAAFAADVQASSETRQISGKIVPLGTETGNTSAGAVIFERGSIQIPEPKTIKLLSQHDVKAPLGRAQSFTETDDAIHATFKISNSSRGTDALILASEGLQAGLSVGVEVIKSKPIDGVIHVSAARLMEVSLVTEPAFKSAQVTDIAAEETEEVSDVVEETQPTESETAVENTPETVAAPEVEAAAVEAARPTVTAMAYTKPRQAPLTSGQYLEHSIKAATGSDESRQIIRAADDDSTTNTGLTLAPHMQEFITNQVTSRAAIEAGSRGALPASGLSFTIPRVTGNTAVADVNEGATTTETGMTSDYLTVNVNKFAGMQTVSWELLDRSAPLFYDEMIKNLTNQYANATDAAVIAALLAGGTAASTTAATAAGFQSFVATETAAAYKGTGQFARNLVASTDVWAAIMGYADSTGRSLYTAAQPANASGAVAPTALTGSVLGLNLYVDPNIGVSGVIDNSCYIVSPEAYTTYESPTTKLQVQVLGSGQVEIAVYGYLAIAVKNPLAIRKFNLT